MYVCSPLFGMKETGLHQSLLIQRLLENDGRKSIKFLTYIYTLNVVLLSSKVNCNIGHFL
ncbi:hypothetical protein A8709_29840 [Paenibacillus pectinilyticus]|uniref:Uncharacterized protein n=1 Tax=Paenibacillus pectinilyticus TaxID=512399 RepID=A0A1C0ZVI7_9BACL|nr:hypothetical protein A8709_29840 [Paenibacillus pectinilyticus]